MLEECLEEEEREKGEGGEKELKNTTMISYLLLETILMMMILLMVKIIMYITQNYTKRDKQVQPYRRTVTYIHTVHRDIQRDTVEPEYHLSLTSHS